MRNALGDLTAANASSSQARRVLHSSISAEWYTPPRYIAAVCAVLGRIDLDPASCPAANAIVQARQYYTAREDGLRQPWHGRIFVNPPYGRCNGESNQAAWSRKLIGEYEAGRVCAAILLVNATPEAAWFQRLWAFALCFTDHRIRFLGPHGDANSPTHGSVFAYLGPCDEKFAAVFRSIGHIVLPVAGPGGRNGVP